jgi:acid phosphatase class B
MQTFRQIVLVLALASVAFARPPTNDSGKRLIKFSEDEPAKWLSQEEVEALSLSGHRIHFIDITDRTYPTQVRRVNTNGKYQS